MKVTPHSAGYVAGTSLEITQRQIIRDNVAAWRAERRRRAVKVEKRDFITNFNAVGEALKGKRVIV